MRRAVEEIIAEAESLMKVGRPTDALKALEGAPVVLAVLRLRYHAFSTTQQLAMANCVAELASTLYPMKAEPRRWRAEVASKVKAEAGG